MKRIAVLVAVLLFSTVVYGAEDLSVVSAGPVGEVASLAEANEIRVVFTEPMVVLGKIPQPVTAPFFKIAPAVKGSFRWSGTTTLIFTPDPKTPLPYGTQFTVTIDKSAKSELTPLGPEPWVRNADSPQPAAERRKKEG
jgi:hypothetical protein